MCARGNHFLDLVQEFGVKHTISLIQDDVANTITLSAWMADVCAYSYVLAKL